MNYSKIKLLPIYTKYEFLLFLVNRRYLIKTNSASSKISIEFEWQCQGKI